MVSGFIAFVAAWNAVLACFCPEGVGVSLLTNTRVQTTHFQGLYWPLREQVRTASGQNLKRTCL